MEYNQWILEPVNQRKFDTMERDMCGIIDYLVLRAYQQLADQKDFSLHVAGAKAYNSYLSVERRKPSYDWDINIHLLHNTANNANLVIAEFLAAINDTWRQMSLAPMTMYNILARTWNIQCMKFEFIVASEGGAIRMLAHWQPAPNCTLQGTSPTAIDIVRFKSVAAEPHPSAQLQYISLEQVLQDIGVPQPQEAQLQLHQPGAPPPALPRHEIPQYWRKWEGRLPTWSAYDILHAYYFGKQWRPALAQVFDKHMQSEIYSFSPPIKMWRRTYYFDPSLDRLNRRGIKALFTLGPGDHMPCIVPLVLECDPHYEDRPETQYKKCLFEISLSSSCGAILQNDNIILDGRGELVIAEVTYTHDETLLIRADYYPPIYKKLGVALLNGKERINYTPAGRATHAWPSEVDYDSEDEVHYDGVDGVDDADDADDVGARVNANARVDRGRNANGASGTNKIEDVEGASKIEDVEGARPKIEPIAALERPSYDQYRHLAHRTKSRFLRDGDFSLNEQRKVGPPRTYAFKTLFVPVSAFVAPKPSEWGVSSHFETLRGDETHGTSVWMPRTEPFLAALIYYLSVNCDRASKHEVHTPAGRVRVAQNFVANMQKFVPLAPPQVKPRAVFRGAGIAIGKFKLYFVTVIILLFAIIVLYYIMYQYDYNADSEYDSYKNAFFALFQ